MTRIVAIATLVLLSILAAGRPAAAADFVAHRAFYEITLKSADNKSGVVGLSGAMVYEVMDACEGWENNQTLRLNLAFSNAPAMSAETSFTSWESKDGTRYRFSVRNGRDGEIYEELRGSADLDGPGGGGQARFTKPEAAVKELPAGVLFPTAQIEQLMQIFGETDRKFVSARVFDGASFDGAYDVSAVLVGEPAVQPDMLDTPELSGQTGYPIRFAYFAPDSQDPAPEYEYSLVLQENGIARDVVIDYGDFSMHGELVDIDILPAADCS
jgi:hypothetical protein